MQHHCWMIDRFSALGEKRANIFDDTAYSYADLGRQIDNDLKHIAEEGIESGAVVAINSDYTFEAIALFFALADNKNIIVPIISNTSEEIASRLKSAEADYIISLDNGRFAVRKLGADTPKHAYIHKLILEKRSGLVLFSSGSTGEPKAMLHDLDRLMEGYKGRNEKEINTLIFLTFDHIGGIDTLLRLLSIGGTVTIPTSRQPEEVSRLIERHQVNVLPSSPTFLNLLLLSGLHQKYDFSSLKIIAFGAEPMPESLLLRLRGFFPDLELQQKFGTSETNAITVTSRSSDSLFMKLDEPNLKHKVIDGELWLKSKTQVLGYLNASMESFTEDGWFKTGDLV
ncbi:MAG TPA: long-chain fatty acid--CoA ligase, partial [Epsilonproteobacteria bacterium]|nr:long-chain fatty acid--CoA ligase [Campylobacterota bacterium]